MTYRHALCHHCGLRPAQARCRDCDQHLCEPCAVDGRCPSCWRDQIAATGARRKRRWRLGSVLVAATLLCGAARVAQSEYGDHRDRTASQAAKLQLRTVQQALASYTLEHGDCPDVLGALHGRNYLQRRDLTDSWGEPLDYQCALRARGRGIQLASAGPDRRPGTADDIRLDHEIRW